MPNVAATVEIMKIQRRNLLDDEHNTETVKWQRTETESQRDVTIPVNHQGHLLPFQFDNVLAVLVGQSSFTAFDVLINFVKHAQELPLKVVDGPDVGRSVVNQPGIGTKA